jgi:hypothetical protein
MLLRLRSVPPLATALALILTASCNSDKVLAPVTASRAARDVAPVDAASGVVLLFNGTTSGAATPLGQPVTVATEGVIQAMIRWNGPTSNAVQLIAYNGNTALNGWGIALQNGKLSVLAAAVGFPQSTLAPKVGVWQHVYASRSGGTVHVELDGVGQDLTGLNAFAPTTTNSRTMIGAAYPTDGSALSAVFNGAIDDVRFSALDGTTIEDWNFDDLAGVTAVGANGNVLTLTDVAVLRILQISIDPRHEGRLIQPERGGKIAVALLSGPGFDATTVDPSTVTFGPSRAPVLSAERVDIDRDGAMDMLYRFDLAATGLTCLDRTASLDAVVNGELTDGTDSIHTAVADLAAHSYMVRCANPRIIATEMAPGDPSFNPNSINDRGVVGGYTMSGTASVAARWTNGTLETYAAPNGSVVPTPINAHGQMGLLTSPSTGPLGVAVWSGGAPTTFSAPGTVSQVSFVGDHGDPVGVSTINNNVLTLWHLRNGKTEILSASGGGFIIPSNITTDGVIGGVMSDPVTGQPHPFLWNGKKVTEFGKPDDNIGVAAMNTRGQIIGYIVDPATSNLNPFIWSAEGTTAINSQSYPAFINNRGEVALVDLNTGALSVWSNGQITSVDPTEAGFGTVGLNDNGQILTAGADFATPTIMQPDGSSLSLLGGQLHSGGQPVGLNDNGEVIGYATRPDGQFRAMIWRLTGK